MTKDLSINKPKLIGLTGSIGSGKSTVAKIFESIGIPIYDSDAKAKWLMQNDESLKTKISSFFGKDIYLPSGALDKAKLANIVFNNSNKLQRLNSFVHPAVKVNFQSWVNDHPTAPYVLKEAAILFESKANKGLDKVICVIAPQGIRQRRVMSRDGVSIDQVKAREANQWVESAKARQAHYIISNDELHPLIPQVIGLHTLWKNSQPIA